MNFISSYFHNSVLNMYALVCYVSLFFSFPILLSPFSTLAVALAHINSCLLNSMGDKADYISDKYIQLIRIFARRADKRQKQTCIIHILVLDDGFDFAEKANRLKWTGSDQMVRRACSISCDRNASIVWPDEHANTYDATTPQMSHKYYKFLF